MKTLVLIVLFLGEQAFAADKLEDIACGPFIDSIPYSSILQLPKSPDPLAQVLSILEDSSKQRCWSNSVWMVGVLGGQAQADYLIKRISIGSGELERAEWNAKSMAVLSLGLLANKGGARALEFLEMLVSRKNEKGNPFSWKPPEYIRDDSFNVYLARRAVQALGVSGRPEAKAFLEKFKDDSQLKDVVADALLLNDRVLKNGLASVYRE